MITHEVLTPCCPSSRLTKVETVGGFKSWHLLLLVLHMYLTGLDCKTELFIHHFFQFILTPCHVCQFILTPCHVCQFILTPCHVCQFILTPCHVCQFILTPCHVCQFILTPCHVCQFILTPCHVCSCMRETQT